MFITPQTPSLAESQRPDVLPRSLPRAIKWSLALCILVVSTLTFWTATTALAQCDSNSSSCVNCHEVERRRPILQSPDPWHVQHGFGDLCAACHGGRPESLVEAEAHLGLRNPLTDSSVSCASCHQDNHASLMDIYRTAAKRRDAERETPAVSVLPQNRGDAESSATVASVDAILGLIAIALSLAILLVLRSDRKRRTADATTPRPQTSDTIGGPPLGLGRRTKAWLAARLTDPTWSPYAAGALLGVVVAVSELACGRPLAASGAFDKLAAYPGSALFPDSQYYAHVMSPAITWQVWLVVGILGGAFLASKASKQARFRWLPDFGWEPRFGPSRLFRLSVAFFGAVLVQLGAGIAGGCTSGLAISGGAVLAPAAFVFMAGMFAGGIPTANLWHRQRKGGR